MNTKHRLRRSAVAHLSRVLLEDLEALESEIDRLKAENERLRKQMEQVSEQRDRFVEYTQERDEQIRNLRAQRDAYADPAHWEGSYGLDPDHLPRMVPRLTCRYTGPTPSDSTEADEGER